MGVEIDPRTKLNPAYTIDYPASDPESDTGDYYSIRQELQWIAAAHAGIWWCPAYATGFSTMRWLSVPCHTSIISNAAPLHSPSLLYALSCVAEKEEQ